MKIFVLLPRIPYPLEKGDKLRAFNHIRYLSKNNDIYLCALNDARINKQEAFKAVQPYIRSVTFIDHSLLCRVINVARAFFSGKPLQTGYFYSKRTQRKINGLIKSTQPDHLFCQLVRTAEYIKNSSIPKTLDYQDAFSKGLERRIHTSPWYKVPFLKFEYKRLLKYENRIFGYFDNCTIISKPDQELIPHEKKHEIIIVPNGVDTDFFKPLERPKTYHLVFNGNMSYPPNINGAEYIAREILPLLIKKKPEIRILLSGATPDKRVRALQSGHIHISGWVDDIRESYACARIFIAPMQIGIGLQNKLLEAMAMKIPAITSVLANNALNARPGEDILVGNTPEEYVNHIINLLDNPDFSDTIARNGYNFVQKNYNWENATAILESIMAVSSGFKKK